MFRREFFQELVANTLVFSVVEFSIQRGDGDLALTFNKSDMIPKFFFSFGNRAFDLDVASAGIDWNVIGVWDGIWRNDAEEFSTFKLFVSSQLVVQCGVEPTEV